MHTGDLAQVASGHCLEFSPHACLDGTSARTQRQIMGASTVPDIEIGKTVRECKEVQNLDARRVVHATDLTCCNVVDKCVHPTE